MQYTQYGVRDQLLSALAQSGGWLLAAARMLRSRDHHAAQVCLQAVRCIRDVDDALLKEPMPLRLDFAQTIMDLADHLHKISKEPDSETASHHLRLESGRLRMAVIQLGATLDGDGRYWFKSR
jgi:hypothetical protein